MFTIRMQKMVPSEASLSKHLLSLTCLEQPHAILSEITGVALQLHDINRLLLLHPSTAGGGLSQGCFTPDQLMFIQQPRGATQSHEPLKFHLF